MSAKFYAEDLGITDAQASRLSWFLCLSKSCKFVKSATPWANHGKCRVYIEPWSQNSLDAVSESDKFYYDVDQDAVFVSRYAYGNSWIDPLDGINKSVFSGAKTRQACLDFMEVFNEQKPNRD